MVKNFKKTLYRKLLEYDLEQYAKKTALLSDYIPPESKVVDVGCGSGRFAKFLEGRFHCEVTGFDVVDYLVEDIPFLKYEGKRLPIEDKFFDVALCMAVLHHSPDPEGTLKELSRIAKRVILIEDYCSTPQGKVGLHLNDYFTNIFQNLYKCWCGYHPWSVYQMQWKLKFKTELEWKQLFEDLGMQLISYHRTQLSWKGMSHGVYVLG